MGSGLGRYPVIQKSILVKNFEKKLFLPGQLVKAASDLYRADPAGSLLVSEGAIGTVMAHEPTENVFDQSWKVCFEGTHEWYVSSYEVELVSPIKKQQS